MWAAILAALKALAGLFGWLKEKHSAEAAVTKVHLDEVTDAAKQTSTAVDARERVRSDAELHPERVRDHNSDERQFDPDGVG